jgi:hypothetical protein
VNTLTASYDPNSFGVEWSSSGWPVWIQNGGVFTAQDGVNSFRTWEFNEATGILRLVPEPGTLALLGVCAIGLLGRAWRRRRQAA